MTTSNPDHAVAVPEPAVLLQLREHGRRHPDALALRHKVRGTWYVWRWRDVAEEVARLTAGLAARGFGPRQRLAVSGDLRPHMLLLALAARASGAGVIAVPRHIGEADLSRLLRARSIGHAFLHGREPLALWLKAAAQADVELLAICDHANPNERARHPQVVTYRDLRDAAAAPLAASTVERRVGARSKMAWTEESTDWVDGPEILLGSWLAGDFTLAFPESGASAERDRREARPDRLIVSAGRLAALHADILDRLAPSGTLQRRLVDGRLGLRGAARGGVIGGILARRLRRSLGLGRVREIVVVPGGEGVPASTRRFFDGLGTRVSPASSDGLARSSVVPLRPQASAA